jgi:hypothetical protein
MNMAVGLTTGGDKAKRRDLDFYPTPPAGTLALMRFLKLSPCRIWEPACGNGAMSRVLESGGHSVWSTDINQDCYGDDRDRGRWENPCIQKRVASGKQVNLSMIAQGSSGSPAQMGNQGQLNPQFVSWLMGYKHRAPILHDFGNAIVPSLAAEFIKATM